MNLPVKNNSNLQSEEEVQDFLYFLFELNINQQNQRLVLPSLSSLARLFGISQLSVHGIFQGLRAEGYHYELDKLDDPIYFWHHQNSGLVCHDNIS